MRLIKALKQIENKRSFVHLIIWGQYFIFIFKLLIIIQFIIYW